MTKDLQMRVLVIGTSGFVGNRLAESLSIKGIDIRGYNRSEHPSSYPLTIGDLDDLKRLKESMKNIDTVVLTAGKSNHVGDTSTALETYRKCNTQGSINVAKAAIEAGIKRLIYISSIKVNGETTTTPFDNQSCYAPETAYGVSKMEAEIALKQLSKDHCFDLIIIRPPLIYGSGMKGNLAAIMKSLRHPIPLPVAGIDNRRSLLYIENLIDLIEHCLLHQSIGSQTFLASDNQDISTRDLFYMLRGVVSGKAWLIPLPKKILEQAFIYLRKQQAADKILGDLVLDISYTCKVLGWHPPYTVEEAMQDLKQQATKKND